MTLYGKVRRLCNGGRDGDQKRGHRSAISDDVHAEPPSYASSMFITLVGVTFLFGIRDMFRSYLKQLAEVE